MLTLAEKSRPVQNIGLIDRTVRFLIGAGLVGYIFSYHEMKLPGVSIALQVLAVTVSLYPLMTAMFGWDPFYALLNVGSCGGSGRNQCGTLPYQIKAVLGRAPKYCDSDAEHSLEACHDEPVERPHHETWHVNQRPMIYPDEADWDDYFNRHAAPAKMKKAS